MAGTLPTPSAVLLDIDGVLVVSWEAAAGAVDALARVRRAGVPVRFLTNTTSATAAEIRDRLEASGFAVAPGEILTAAVATAAHLAAAHAGQRCYVLDDGPRDDLAAAGVEWVDDAADAQVVVIGGAGPPFGWEAMNGALRAVLGGAALIAMHGACRWQSAEGPWVDGGAYVALLEAAAGVSATVVGKPAAGMFTAALEQVGAEPAHAVMVGDDVAADVLAAQALGITGVLVRTGKFQPVDEHRVPPPDRTIDSIADLPDLLGLA